MAETITVEAVNGHYGILIEPGIMTAMRDHVGRFDLGGRVAIITNETIAPLYGEKLAGQLPNAVVVTMPDGEAHKTVPTMMHLCQELANAGLDRGSVVIALGGGVVGDTAGFTAAVYMRGVQLVQMPTTLLSMVDSSVGGKVGVDLPEGKNLVGVFKQPDLVIIDPNVLDTLPEAEWRNGMAEVIKHGLLADPALLDPALWQRDRAEELIRRAVQVKVDVVEKDPFEQGERAWLNLGHTFAHAIERVTEYAVPHGQAVGIGLLAAVKLSARLQICDPVLVAHVDAVLGQVGLARSTQGLDPAALLAAMQTDKKWRGGVSRFVLLHSIGNPTIVQNVDNEAVLAVLEEMK